MEFNRYFFTDNFVAKIKYWESNAKTHFVLRIRHIVRCLKKYDLILKIESYNFVHPEHKGVLTVYIVFNDSGRVPDMITISYWILIIPWSLFNKSILIWFLFLARVNWLIFIKMKYRGIEWNAGPSQYLFYWQFLFVWHVYWQ